MNKLLILFSLLFFFSACNTKEDEKAQILFYCAAGMKPAVSVIANEYSKKYNVDISIQYGGSGTLLSNIRIVKSGDLYLAGDDSYTTKALEYGLVDEIFTAAYLTPVLVVKKGNPKNINSLNDLLQNQLKISIANPSAASVGRLTKKMLSENKLWDKLQENIKVFKPTVNDVANDVKIGSVDVGIVWDATGYQYKDLQNIKIPEFEKYRQTVTLAVLKSTKNAKETIRFARYLTARDKGLKIFEKFKFTPVAGDKWEETPRIVFYSGGVNRIAVEQTIRAFEKREGVEITTVYNGCGILVGQIKTGQRPDAYLTCDTSFMDQVEDYFSDIRDVSKTQIVIITDKENSRNIHSLQDLTQNDLKIGVCNPKQSALGSLTEKLLNRHNLLSGIMKNVRSQTPTADLLVNQLRTGSLDAAIVYMANTSQVKDKISVIPIDLQDAFATQNYGLGRNSEHKNLMKRLFKAITSKKSQENYLQNGFEWKYVPKSE